MQKQTNVHDINLLITSYNYDKMYKELCAKYDIFTERMVRGDLLIWDLPGDGWTSLDNADPITQSVARGEIAQLQQNVPPNSLVAKCFRTPGDDFIFVKSEGGKLHIKLTAWGYIKPQRIVGDDARGKGGMSASTQRVVLKILSNGNPAAGKPFAVLRPDGGANHFATDSAGRFDFFTMPVGTSVQLEINGKRECFVVESGKTEYVINIQEEQQKAPEPPKADPHKVDPLKEDPTMRVHPPMPDPPKVEPPKVDPPNVAPPLIDTPGGNTGNIGATGGNTGNTGNTVNTDNTGGVTGDASNTGGVTGNTGGNTDNTGKTDDTGKTGTTGSGGTIYVPVPEDNTGRWKKVLTIIGLVLLTAGTYYACSQILM